MEIQYFMFQAMLSGPGQFAENETNEVKSPRYKLHWQ